MLRVRWETSIRIIKAGPRNSPGDGSDEKWSQSQITLKTCKRTHTNKVPHHRKQILTFLGQASDEKTTLNHHFLGQASDEKTNSNIFGSSFGSCDDSVFCERSASPWWHVWNVGAQVRQGSHLMELRNTRRSSQNCHGDKTLTDKLFLMCLKTTLKVVSDAL